MPKYRFIVQSPSGKSRRGTISERDEDSAKQALSKAGFQVVSLTEVADLVVHTPATSAGGRTRVKPERASIIEFEENFGEKLWSLSHRYFLRREAAIVLAVLGLILIVVSAFQSPGEIAPPALEYKVVKITVNVDTKGYEGNSLEVLLPDIPFTVKERVEPDSDKIQSVDLEIEVAVIPNRVEVALWDGSTVKAKATGTLTATAVEGEFSFSPDLVTVKSEDD